MQGHTDDQHAELLRELVDSDARRAVVRVLSAAESPLTFDAVAAEVEAHPYGSAPAIRVYHIHLPKLASLGAVEWDRETDSVRLTASGEEALGTVESLDGHARQRQSADD